MPTTFRNSKVLRGACGLLSRCCSSPSATTSKRFPPWHRLKRQYSSSQLITGHLAASGDSLHYFFPITPASSRCSRSMPVRMALALPSRKTLLFIALCLLWYSTSFLSASTSKALLSPNKVKRVVPLLASGLQNGSLDPNVAANGGSAEGSSSSPSSTSGVSTVKTPPLFPYPVSLTALQFFFVFSFSYLLSSPTIAAFLYARLRLSPPKDAVTGRPRGLMGTLVMVNAAKLREMVGLSVFNVTGHAMTSAAIQMVPVSTVHTVKVSGCLRDIADRLRAKLISVSRPAHDDRLYHPSSPSSPTSSSYAFLTLSGHISPSSP